MIDRALHHLHNKLEEERGYIRDFLATGGAKDYTHYRELCAKIEGLTIADNHMQQMLRNLENDDDDN